MTARKVLVALFWMAMIAAPLVIVGVEIATLPPETTRVPMQVGFDGTVNRWGPPEELWIIGGIFAAVNAMMALTYRFIDPLYALGLVHGVSRKNAPRFLVVLTLALTVLVFFCLHVVLLSRL